MVDGALRFTYRDFATRCDRLAWALREDLGVHHGDRVAWLCGNTHELLEAYFGVLLAGAVLVPLNIRLAPPELRSMLDDCDARVLFRHPDQSDPTGPTRPGRQAAVPTYQAARTCRVTTLCLVSVSHRCTRQPV